MKKTVATLLMTYDIELCQTNAKLEADFSVAAPALKPLLVTVKPKP